LRDGCLLGYLAKAFSELFSKMVDFPQLSISKKERAG
jgi:hypothetical protein